MKYSLNEQKQLLKWPRFDQKTINKVVATLAEDEDQIYEHAHVFEKEWSSFIGAKYSLSTNSGTSALHAALCGLDLPEGSEVLVPTYTFWASIMPLRHYGLVPVFCDVDPYTGNIDISDATSKITEKTKAIIVVHLWGVPAELDDLEWLCRDNGLFMIEDASHSHGAMWGDKRIGNIGHVSFFSFQSSKLLPILEGGIMSTNVSDIYEKALRAGHYLHLKNLSDNHPLSYLKNASFGNKYRIHPLSAILGLEGLKEFNNSNECISMANQYFQNKISGLKEIKIPTVSSQAKRTYYGNCVHLISNRILKSDFEKLVVNKGGMLGKVQYPLQHQLPIYRDTNIWKSAPVIQGSFIGAHKLKKQEIAFPRFLGNSYELIDEYIQLVSEILI